MTLMSQALVVAGLLIGLAPAPPLTSMERQRLLAHLEMTERWLLDEVSSLTPPQLDFRPAPASWTVREVVDHLVVVGTIYWEDLQGALKAPAAARENPTRDDNILWYGIDRTNREKAVPPELPKGRAQDFSNALAAFRRDHARLTEFIKSTPIDLRAHFVERQQCDAYQWALLISTHEQRHILQIRDIKAHTAFPR
jgi:hypothetical protein